MGFILCDWRIQYAKDSGRYIKRRWFISKNIGKIILSLSAGYQFKKESALLKKELLFHELRRIAKWYDSHEELRNVAADYRIKSIQSAFLKYQRYYPDHQAVKVFNDMLGFRTLCDNYEDILLLKGCMQIRIANMSNGKASDDGYRGIHVYFQLDNFHYPIEIQYNTYYDRQINNWLHKFIYGSHLADFKERLLQEIGYDRIQLVTISRPSAYGEYEPYHFVDTEAEFEQAVKSM